MKRVDHLRKSRAWHHDLGVFQRSIGLSGRHWRSWRRHPLANVVYRWWNTVPHLPRWETEEWGYGPVGGDEVYTGEYERCRHCGLQRNEREVIK